MLVGRLDNRLERQRQLAARQRQRQIVLERPPFIGALTDCRLVTAGGTATVRLDFIQRQIGAFQQRFDTGTIAWPQCIANTGAYRCGMAIKIEWLCQPGDDGRSNGIGAARRGVGQHHGELVAAQPGDGGAAADGITQPASGFAQQPVASAMAKRVVDGLEAIEIDEQQRAGLAGARRPRQRVLQCFAKQRAVGKAGQRIEARQLGDAIMAAPRLGDIAADPAIAREPPCGIGFRRSR